MGGAAGKAARVMGWPVRRMPRDAQAGAMGTLLVAGGMIGSHKQLVLRRSEDGGHSWSDIAYPCG